MSARAIIAPMSFGDSNLPRINITYIRPIPGATYDWAINQMPNGALSQWPSLTGGAALTADGTSPVVVNDGKSRCVRFDGISSRMRAPFNLAGEHSVVAVYRFLAPKALDTIHYGYLSSASPQLGLTTGGDTVRATSGSSALFPSPLLPPDTSWHISVVTVNGANSALRIDDSETAGTLTPGTRDGITLGFSGAPGNRAAIEYKRVAIVPGKMTPAQRGAIVEQMRSEYVS